MDPAEHLPVELLRRIIELAAALPYNRIDYSFRMVKSYRLVFRPLILVSHGWEEIVRPILYQEIVLNSQGQAVALARTLERQPERSALIRHLEVFLSSWELGEKGREAACSVIKQVGALQKLALEASPDLRQVDFPTEIHLDGYPHLTNLELNFFAILSTPTLTFPVLPHLLTLTLANIGLPLDSVALAHCFPNVSTLEFSPLDRTLGRATLPLPPSAHFLLAIAPQLHTLRLQNRLHGVPISLIRQLLHLGASLHTLECSRVEDDSLSEARPGAEVQIPPSPSSRGPPLHLKFALAGIQGQYAWFVPKKEEILLESVRPWIEVPLARILEVRPIGRVALESWWAEDLAHGSEMAIEHFRKQRLQLDFEPFGSFMS